MHYYPNTQFGIHSHAVAKQNNAESMELDELSHIQDSKSPNSIESSLDIQAPINSTPLDSISKDSNLAENLSTQDSISLDSNEIEKLTAQSNENGIICCIDGRYYLRLHRILLQNGKEVDSIHSGNTNPIALPFKLPPFSFLRVRL